MSIIRIIGTSLALFFIFSLTSNSVFGEDQVNHSPLGFEFGMSKKDALKLIKAKRLQILDNSVDSKKIRTILIEGAIVQLPIDINIHDVKTELEFYKDKLMSSSLICRPNSESNQPEMENNIYNFLVEKYGEPKSKDKILHFMTWNWKIPDVLVVFSTSRKTDWLKLSYTYEPVNTVRYERELDIKRKGKPSDPAKQMFLDGNYSADSNKGFRQ